ncbi:MAG: putative acetyltransferase [Acidimicrobiales bacterium]|nr:putative acetyltransferase [Acidimicrobiales bacterium]
MRSKDGGTPLERSSTLFGQRVMLRPIVLSDFVAWREVRQRCGEWLTRWEPARLSHQPDVTEDRDAFAVRCSARLRERQLGTGYGFGIFAEGQLCGEINLSSIQRGPFQNAYVGYWIDEKWAGQGLMPEAVVVLARFGFEELHLHRLQISIIPRNTASHRVVEKLGLRNEGVAERYLEINGRWEDHVRYAITAEEWEERRADLEAAWLSTPAG